MQWNPDALNDDPDVAEVTTRPSKPRPRWLIRVVVWVVVIAVVALVLWRITADKATASLQQVRFVTKYAAEVDFVARNETGDDLYVLPQVADRAGFQVAGMTVRGQYYEGAPSPVGLAQRRTESITLRLAVTDCALAVNGEDSTFGLALLVGPYSGARDTVPVDGTMPSWSSLVPPVCDDTPDRGVAAVADVDIEQSGQGAAEIDVTIQNTGGRLLTWKPHRQTREAGRVSVRSDRDVDSLRPGQSAEFEVLATRNGCTTSGNGPATVVLEFASGAAANQLLSVELDSSWTNLLGPCPTARPRPAPVG